jgi:hypothetical protein
MLKKHLILPGIIISISLLVIATLYYPGGSQINKNSVGYDWKNNYISNLFGKTAINGAHNTSRIWAIWSIIFLACSFALFFVDFSNKIPQKSAANIIKYIGVSAMFFTALIATPLHDTMIFPAPYF